MDQLSIDFTAAAAARDAGMQQALCHAEAEAEGWGDRAMASLKRFIDSAREPFLIEDVRAAAEREGLDPPPDARAWGAVVMRAARAEIIRKAGYAPARTSHCSIKPLWEGI